jgi:hypothetical protein
MHEPVSVADGWGKSVLARREHGPLRPPVSPLA